MPLWEAMAAANQTDGLDPPLQFADVHASFGPKEILRGVTLTLREGEVLSLFGGNGAGKSTLLKVAAGLLRPTRGRILAGGREITGFRPHLVARAGVGYHPQGGRVFPSLTVGDNLDLAGADSGEPLFAELAPIQSRRAGLLSGGERQMLALEMLCRQGPRVLMLDEPSAGLAPPLIAGALRRLVEWIRRTGRSMLLVEQNVVEARAVSDRSLRLADGRVDDEARSGGCES